VRRDKQNGRVPFANDLASDAASEAAAYSSQPVRGHDNHIHGAIDFGGQDSFGWRS
jgi:hypothetical protein